MSTEQFFISGSQKLARWSFSGDFGKQFSAIFNLQMWCFGCDIRRPEGNLLRRYGFERHALPGNTYGSSHYIRNVSKETTLHLLGFAVVLEDAENGIVVRRYERTPRLFQRQRIVPGLHRPHQLPDTFTPIQQSSRQEANRLLMHLAQELARYEAFVGTSTPSTFQRSRLSTAPKTGTLPRPMQLDQAWNTLAGLAQQQSHTIPEGSLKEPSPVTYNHQYVSSPS